MTNLEAMVAYDNFFKKYPSGELTKDQFLEEYKGNVMGETFFKIFDEDESGTMRLFIYYQNCVHLMTFYFFSFYEYMTVKTAKLNEPEEKLKWLFNLFDKGELLLFENYHNIMLRWWWNN